MWFQPSDLCPILAIFSLDGYLVPACFSLISIIPQRNPNSILLQPLSNVSYLSDCTTQTHIAYQGYCPIFQIGPFTLSILLLQSPNTSGWMLPSSTPIFFPSAESIQQPIALLLPGPVIANNLLLGMDYDRTMRLFSQEIEKTDRKIQMYINPPDRRSIRHPTVKVDSNHISAVNSPQPTHKHYQQERHSLPNKRLAQRQVCCITVSPPEKERVHSREEQMTRHRTQESNDSLASQKISRVQSVAQQNPQSSFRKSSLGTAGLSNRLPPVSNYERTYYESLSRQVELSKLRKEKQELSTRMEDVDFVQKGLAGFSYGCNHERIMEKVMKKREVDDRRNEQILLKFTKEQEEYKRQKNHALRLLHESRIQQRAANSMNSTLQSETRGEYSYVGRDNTQSIVEEVSETETVEEHQRNETSPLEESTITVKLEPNFSTLTVQQTKPLKYPAPKADAHQLLPLIEQQTVAETTHYSKLNKKSSKVHYTLVPPRKEEKTSTDNALPRSQSKDEDMVNIRKHLELLKHHRLQKLARQRQAQRSLEQPLAEISDMMKDLHDELRLSRSFNAPIQKKVSKAEG